MYISKHTYDTYTPCVALQTFPSEAMSIMSHKIWRFDVMFKRLIDFGFYIFVVIVVHQRREGVEHSVMMTCLIDRIL